MLVVQERCTGAGSSAAARRPQPGPPTPLPIPHLPISFSFSISISFSFPFVLALTARPDLHVLVHVFDDHRGHFGERDFAVTIGVHISVEGPDLGQGILRKAWDTSEAGPMRSIHELADRHVA